MNINSRTRNFLLCNNSYGVFTCFKAFVGIKLIKNVAVKTASHLKLFFKHVPIVIKRALSVMKHRIIEGFIELLNNN